MMTKKDIIKTLSDMYDKDYKDGTRSPEKSQEKYYKDVSLSLEKTSKDLELLLDRANKLELEICYNLSCHLEAIKKSVSAIETSINSRLNDD